MLKRSITVALLMGASWLAQAAHAGELSLFSQPGFSGREITFNAPVRDLSRVGFNDRASSLVVHSGRWQVCEYPDFRGQCVYLDRGEYGDLRQLGDRISSVREVGAARGGWDQDRRQDWDGDRYGRWDQDRRYDDRNDRRYDRDYDGRDERYGDQRYQGPAIELYRKAEFRSDRRDLNEPVLRDFGVIGFHDKTQSMVIRYGQWEFCEHPDFRGRCQVYGPGRYAHLGDMSSKFSSMRRVR